MTVRIRVTPEAEAQAKAAKMWWRANRRLAPAMFRQELAGAFQLLRDAPEVGSLYRGISDIPSVRRLALLQTRHHIYYVYDARADMVIVLAVWSMLRGNPPPLRLT
ncbi:MAG: type II toxin-antitoxin system RelE/ParE family toxin [Polyangiaceae bacterium]|nr:type II toxin-antitoxin system RelE/ParE family toxin [Polyangiaceae bacterium]